MARRPEPGGPSDRVMWARTDLLIYPLGGADAVPCRIE